MWKSGEKPLPSGGSCLLGSINLSEYVKDGEFQFDLFGKDVKTTTAYLDDVLDEGIPFLPLQEQRDSVAKYRQIGLGVMGVADAFIKMGVKYGSKESIGLIDKIGSIMINSALQESAERAYKLGVYPAYKKEYVMKSKFLNEVATQETLDIVAKNGLRNAELLSIAPNGSISTMLGVSGGIEPIFQISYTRKSETLNEDGDVYYEVFTPIAREYMDTHGISNKEQLPDFFVTSSTINYKDRIDVQSTWQKYIDAAISSTVNVPNEFTIEETEDLYMYAWEKGLKGITMFRDGCERIGILTTKNTKQTKPNESLTPKEIDEKIIELQILKYDKAHEAFKNDSEKCPICGGEVKHTGGCEECVDCAWSPCSL